MFIKNINQLNKKDVAIAGGKGASLGEMVNSGFPVPPGFVVLASAFDRFLEETDLGVEIEAILKRVKPDDINSVEKASEEIRDLIRDEKFPDDIGKELLGAYEDLPIASSLSSKGNKEFPPLTKGRDRVGLVAVRSSATAEDSAVASWAGELDSYLNVTRENLLDSVKKCWSSLFTPRAIFYRYEKNLQDREVSVAVVVQAMIEAQVSGICFTVHPVTEDKNQMVIEAGWGLGEAIVGGMITPDTYVIEKARNKKLKFRIMDVNIGEQKKMIVRSAKGTVEKPVPKAKQAMQKLSEKQIVELAEICTKIEKHYKFPQDIEWGLKDDKFFILQSRPITTLKK